MQRTIRGYKNYRKRTIRKKWKTTPTDEEIPLSCSERINTLKMTILLKAVSRFSAIPIKLKVFSHNYKNNHKSLTIHVPSQKYQNIQSYLKKEYENWSNQPSWLQTILLSYRHQESMILSWKPKYIPVEQHRVCR